MSNSLSPWILDFLLHVASDLGAKLYNVEPHKKKKKVQITEFLTYPPKDQEETLIWARISDKRHIATVKFSKEAVITFNKLIGTRLTQNKGAIVTISKFRPICSRFPLEQDRMSSDEFIIFECDEVNLLGCPGEATFGQPKGIEQEQEIRLWAKGISQGGGAGNILKERKLEMEGKRLNKFRMLPPMPTPPLPQPPPFKVDAKPAGILQPPFKRTEDNDLPSYRARWHFLERDRTRFSGPPIEDVTSEQSKVPETSKDENQLAALDLERTPARSRSGTPISNWDNSPRELKSSPMQLVEPEPSSEMKEVVSSSLPAPTPAQRRRTDTPELDPSLIVNETQMSPGTRHSSLARKVPPPASPEPPVPEQTGPGRVLVPNSDTSQSQSQPSQQKLLLGGFVADTTGELPWISMKEIGLIIRRTAELRLRNHRSMIC